MKGGNSRAVKLQTPDVNARVVHADSAKNHVFKDTMSSTTGEYSRLGHMWSNHCLTG